MKNLSLSIALAFACSSSLTISLTQKASATYSDQEVYCNMYKDFNAKSFNRKKCLEIAKNKILIYDSFYTISKSSDLNGSNARVELFIPLEDIRMECNYSPPRGSSGERTKEKINNCVRRRELDNTSLVFKADCLAKRLYQRDRTLQYGWFANEHNELDWNFKDISGDGNVIYQSTASGYFNALKEYYTLCPSQKKRDV